MERRSFFRAASAALAVLQAGAIPVVQAAVTKAGNATAKELAGNEDFWFQVRHAFTLDRNLINFNNGGVCPSPKIVLEAQQRYEEFSNLGPSHWMWRYLTPEVESVRRRLAASFGCDPEELAITRNASEALEIVQLGLNLKPGDEILTTNQDYPRMITTWQQRERRDGVALKQIPFPVPPPSLDDLYERLERAITPRTRVLHFCQITNRTGQIFPVKRICQMARQRGILTVVDGAHAYAQFPFTREDLDCDFYGTSLHKWMLAPIGTGFLYMRRELIPTVWPLMAAPASMDKDIRKFEEIGTHPAAAKNAITEAMTFHESIGGDRKAERLRYLRERWSRRIEQRGKVRILTPYDPEQSCAIGAFGIEGMNAGAIVQSLMNDYKIITVPISMPGEYEAVRVTPNIYTTLEEVDYFATAVETIASKA
jgi:selenocysteine lyase/cysteine desulfurase